jgi:hypothetical protein
MPGSKAWNMKTRTTLRLEKWRLEMPQLLLPLSVDRLLISLPDNKCLLFLKSEGRTMLNIYTPV